MAVASSFVRVVDVGPRKGREERVRDSGIAEIPSREDEEDRVNVPLDDIEEEEENQSEERDNQEEEEKAENP